MGWLIAATAAFIIAPVASSSFLGDDLVNSSINGQLAEHHEHLLTWVWEVSFAILRDFARFIPVTFLEMGSLFHFAPDLSAYKAAQITIIVVAFAAYAWFLLELGLDACVCGLAVLMTLLAVQFHGHYDGYLGFNAQVEFVFILCATSWALFARWLRVRKNWCLLVSIAAFVVAIPTYEAAFPSSVVHVLIAIHLSGRRRWWKAWPFLLLSVLAFAGLALARIIFPLRSDAVYRVEFEPHVYFITLVNQLVASLPLTYFANFRSQLFPAGISLWDAVPWWVVGALGITAASAAYLALRRTAKPAGSLWLPGAIGICIWAQTAVLLCAIPRYQGLIKPGYGYIFMAFGGFGAGLAVACAVTSILATLSAKIRGVCVAGLAVVYAAALCASFATNERTLLLYEAERAARINITSALRDGIISSVPDTSVLFIDSPAQIMHREPAMENDLNDPNNPRYFVRQWANRSVRLHDLEQVPSVLDCGHTSCAAPKKSYAVRDVPIDVRDGFTVMGRLRSTYLAIDGFEHPIVDQVRVHVRGTHLAELTAKGRLALRYACSLDGRHQMRTIVLAQAASAVRAGITFEVGSPCSVDLGSVNLVSVASAGT